MNLYQESYSICIHDRLVQAERPALPTDQRIGIPLVASLLRRYTVSLGKHYPIFWRAAVISSTEWSSPRKTLHSSGTVWCCRWRQYNPSKRLELFIPRHSVNIAEGFNLPQDHCENVFHRIPSISMWLAEDITFQNIPVSKNCETGPVQDTTKKYCHRQ